MSKIIVKLKVIKYKIDITCYLSFLLLNFAIKPSHQAYQFILTILKFSYFKNFNYLF